MTHLKITLVCYTHSAIMNWEQLRLRQNLCHLQKTVWELTAFFDVNFIYRALNFCLNNGHTVTVHYTCSYKLLSPYEYISFWMVSLKLYWVQGLTLYIWAFNMSCKQKYRTKNIGPFVHVIINSIRWYILTLFVTVIWFLVPSCGLFTKLWPFRFPGLNPYKFYFRAR